MMRNARMKAILAMALGVALTASASWGQNPPRPKSQKEIDALQAIQKATTADGQLKAIDNVLENFADTEFKPRLLVMATQIASQKGDYALTITYAERTLDADPKNIFGLSTLALEMVSHTREFDLDKDEKLAKAEKYANQAIANAPNAVNNMGFPDDQWTSLKKDLAAQAHDALGRIAALRKKYDVSITEFKTALDTGVTPDPTTMVRLGDAYLQSNKFDDAISWFDKASAAPNAPASVKSIAASRRADAVKMKDKANPPAKPPAADNK